MDRSRPKKGSLLQKNVVIAHPILLHSVICLYLVIILFLLIGQKTQNSRLRLPIGWKNLKFLRILIRIHIKEFRYQILTQNKLFLSFGKMIWDVPHRIRIFPPSRIQGLNNPGSGSATLPTTNYFATGPSNMNCLDEKKINPVTYLKIVFRSVKNKVQRMLKVINISCLTPAGITSFTK
jgi:hypothetical protein